MANTTHELVVEETKSSAWRRLSQPDGGRSISVSIEASAAPPVGTVVQVVLKPQS